MNTKHDVGISGHVARYSDAIEVGGEVRWLYTSGTPGIDAEGKVPADFAEEAENAWSNVLRLLDEAGFTFDDVVKVDTTLTSADFIPVYREIRERVVGDARPAFMMQVVNQMIRPEFRVEIEIVAASSMAR